MAGTPQDMTGQKFGAWTVLHLVKRADHIKYGTYWMCSCECGQVTKPISRATLIDGKSQSCGCRRKIPIGTKFGRWTVIEITFKTNIRNRGHAWALCRCDCGNEKEVVCASLRMGDSNSCGCLRGFDDVQQSNINKIIGRYKINAQKSDRTWDLPYETVVGLLFSSCSYCGLPPSNVDRHGRKSLKYSGIDRVDNKQGYIPTNVVSCCKICNLAKHTLTKETFLSWINRVFKNQEKNALILELWAGYKEFLTDPLMIEYWQTRIDEVVK